MMKYTKELKGKLAKIIATKEQLAKIGLGKNKEIYPNVFVKIISKNGCVKNLGDIVNIDVVGRALPFYYVIPLKWLKIF